ncbi:MAG: sodium/proline symporter [Anaerolineae bacterium]
MNEFTAIALYFLLILSISASSYRKMASTDFILGNRTSNYWLTALAAHASDMSHWLFMAYPALIFANGLFSSWVAIGLVLFMYLNWHFIASRIRIQTEKSNNLTFFSFLESRFNDQTGSIRLFSFMICFIFSTIYISSGLVGLGLLAEKLFGISYLLAIIIAGLIVVSYVWIGGYLTLAKLDLFQGLFLMVVIVFVPSFIFFKIDGWQSIFDAAKTQNISLSLIPEVSMKKGLEILLLIGGWGLGYFGQPAIITKFMGINDAHQINKSKSIGMSWMIISLSAATFIGIVGIAFFKEGLANPEMLFVQMVKETFHPFFVGLILCAVFAATINVMSSQILVLSSSFAEDIYKKIFRPSASSNETRLYLRLGVLVVALIAFLIAYFKLSSIYSLVLYAWSGLGASFGPVLIFSLYSKRINKSGAWAGMLSGAMTSALWLSLSSFFPLHIDPLVSACSVSTLCIWTVSHLTRKDKAPLALIKDV